VRKIDRWAPGSTGWRHSIFGASPSCAADNRYQSLQRHESSAYRRSFA
jgi:hypothetical protein